MQPDQPSEPPPDPNPDLTCFLPVPGLPSLDGSDRPSSLLDPDETNVGFDPRSLLASENKQKASLTVEFRHSFWQVKRLLMYEALREVVHAYRYPAPKIPNSSILDFLGGGGVVDPDRLMGDFVDPDAAGVGGERDDELLDLDDGKRDRLLRFAQCGRDAFLARTTEPPYRYKIVCNKCRDRFCDACAREKRLIITRNITERCEGKVLRLLTLTLKSSGDPLGNQLTRLYQSFRLFRQRRNIKSALVGGLYFCELTLNDRTRLWHPHLHILFEGDYLPQKVAANVWQDVTKDSFIVDIRALPSSACAAGYVAKYASKALSTSVWHDKTRLSEAIIALHGRRTFATFGTWTKLGLSVIPDDGVDWETCESLGGFLLRVRQGDEEALAIYKQLNNVPVDSLPDDT